MNMPESRAVKGFIEDPNNCSNEKRKYAYKNLFSYTKLFVIHGIDVHYSKRNEKKRTAAYFMKHIFKFSWIFLFFTTISEEHIKISHSDNTKKIIRDFNSVS